MSMLGLRTTIYLVPNLDEAKEWYSQAFGVKPYFDEPFYTGFAIGGYELGLLPEPVGPEKKIPTVLSYWGVEDIHKSYEGLLSKGARTHQEPTNVGGPIVVASVFDPWDNIIGIIYNPVFKISEG